ncbi:hypothetical protein [Streptomyces massasporeus]|uniref:hypothetical protein n=1 Tax=Streptomyces massasporeus TaxID=67324 RepID=UPI001674CA7B|nr:hypothetical protein [Streptomyces massasporeus]GGV66276.1 hypothetical protein GCM10010228_18790 [Streptomyces massasporeus]
MVAQDYGTRWRLSVSLRGRLQDALPFKGAYNPAKNLGWVRKLEDQIVTRGCMVVLDMRNANQAAIDDVKSIVGQHGWSDRVAWYP